MAQRVRLLSLRGSRVGRGELALPWSDQCQRLFEFTMRTVGRALSVLPERRRLYPFESCLADMRRRRALGRSLV